MLFTWHGCQECGGGKGIIYLEYMTGGLNFALIKAPLIVSVLVPMNLLMFSSCMHQN